MNAAQNSPPLPIPKEEPLIDLPQNPFPTIPAPSAVAASTPPTAVSVSSPEIDEYSPHKPFPFMLVTFLLFIVLAFFGGSFLFFGGKIPGGKKTAIVPIVTPPVSPIVVSPTPTNGNPFASPSAAVLNPFASATPTYANPFGEAQNPFSAVVTQTQGENQPYKNPFATP